MEATIMIVSYHTCKQQDEQVEEKQKRSSDSNCYTNEVLTCKQEISHMLGFCISFLFPQHLSLL